MSRKLRNSDELKEYLDGMYAGAAQYDQPPTYPVTQVCTGIDGAPNGTDILGRIIFGINTYLEDTQCLNIDDTPLDETSQGWNWQVSLTLFILWFHVHSNYY